MIKKVWILHLDLAALGYQVAFVLFVVGCLIRLRDWWRYPPNHLMLQRAAGALGSPLSLFKAIVSRILLQRFIAGRGLQRWLAHFLIVWGVLLAGGTSLALTFGLVNFELLDQRTYQAFMLGMPVVTFEVGSVIAFFVLNAINIGSVLLLVGLGLCFYRHLANSGHDPEERPPEIFLPLLVLLAVTLTGLAMTVSYKVLGGVAYRQLGVLHMISVMLGLLWLPYGKLFHVVLSPITAILDTLEEADGAVAAACANCSRPISAAWSNESLVKTVSSVSLIHQRGEVDVSKALALCPTCKRRHQARQISGRPDKTQPL